MLFLCAIVIWYVTLIANARLSPSIPWFVAADLLALYAGYRYLLSQNVLVRALSLKPVGKQAWLFGVGGMLACSCLAVLQGTFWGMRLGLVGRVPGASDITSATALLFLPIYTGICEELVFRGALQTRLSRTLDPPAAIIFTTVLFLAVHYQRSDFAMQWMFLAALSIVLGIVASKFDSVPLCVLLHGSVNFVSAGVTLAFGPFSLTELSCGARLAVACLGAACAAVAILSMRLKGSRAIHERGDAR